MGEACSIKGETVGKSKEERPIRRPTCNNFKMDLKLVGVVLAGFMWPWTETRALASTVMSVRIPQNVGKSFRN
jgi:hypothetical protein